MAKKLYSIRLDSNMLADLERLAKKQNRTTANLIETILLNYLAKDKKDGIQKQR